MLEQTYIFCMLMFIKIYKRKKKAGAFFLNGVDRGSRTPKDFSTWTWIMRVYQFRHIDILLNFHLGETELSLPSIGFLQIPYMDLYSTQNVTFSHLLLFANGVLAISTYYYSITKILKS